MKKFVKNNDLEKLSVGFLKKDESMMTIYVGNLSYNKSEQGLLEIFRKYGYVSFVRVSRDKKTHRSTGIAFIQMQDKDAALKAISELNGTQLDGRTLKVSVAIETPKKKKRVFRRR